MFTLYSSYVSGYICLRCKVIFVSSTTVYKVGHKKPSAYMSANYVFQKQCTFKLNNAR